MRRVMRLFSLALALAAASGPASTRPEAVPEPCSDSRACLARLRVLSAGHDPDGGAHQDAFALAARMAAFPETVPALVALLADDDEAVAELAAIMLRETPTIAPEHLPALEAGLDRGLGWLPAALGNIPGDEVARVAVARYLVSRGAPENQEAYAIEKLGERALPAILEAARCPSGCGRKDAYLLGEALRRIGAAAAPIAPDLLALAADPATPGDVTRGALWMLESLGPHARDAVPGLLALRDAKPEHRHDIDDALIAGGTAEAGAIFAERLREQADVVQLEDLAALGPAGIAAGPALVALLDPASAGDVAARAPSARFIGADPDGVRVAAARALGAVGYAPAVGRLVELLDDPRDVRLNWAAAESLGRLAVADAAPALERVAATHWYPPVRARAAASLADVRSGTARTAPPPGDDLPEMLTFDAFDDPIPEDIAACGDDAPADVGQRGGVKLYAHRPEDEARLQSLAYDSEILSYGASDEAEQRAADEAAGETPVIEVNPGNVVEHRQPVREAPAMALKVPGGWLAGSNRGEWGGELMFLPDAGTPVKLYDANIEDIYRFGEGWIATTGVVHLGINRGTVLAVRRDATGRWSASTWRVLPAATVRSWFVASGELLIEALGKGTLLLAPDGGFRMADCAPRPAAPRETDAATQAAADAAEAAAAAAAALGEESADTDSDE